MGTLGQVYSTLIVLATVGSASDEESPSPDPKGYLRVIRAEQEPVAIKSMRVETRKGQPRLVVEVANSSGKAIRFLRYSLMPPNCGVFDHPFGYDAGYGDWSALDGKSHPKLATSPPVEPGKVVEVSIPWKVVESYRRRAEKGHCSSLDSDFQLERLAFTDGTGWEGYAAGEGNNQWSGRQWIPKPRPPKKPKKR